MEETLVTNIPPVSPCILVTGLVMWEGKAKGVLLVSLPSPLPSALTLPRGPPTGAGLPQPSTLCDRVEVQNRKPICFLTEATFFNTSFIGNKDETLFFISLFFLTKLSRSYLGKEGGITGTP